MSTTTVRLPADLKKRVARAAKRAGTTSHGFILEAVAQQTHAQELRDEFHAIADARFAGIVATGKSVSWAVMRGFLEKRARGESAARPRTRKLSR
ncbi:MAG: CopG family transcriptional regulator [Lysobacterales bacterium]